MRVKCEKYNCKHNVNKQCNKDTIIIEDIKYVSSGICYNYEKMDIRDYLSPKVKEAKYTAMELDELFQSWSKEGGHYTSDEFIVEQFIEWMKRL